jgi:hypothetical protein
VKRLSDMTNAELVEEAKRTAAEAREADRLVGELLDGVLASVDELTRRLDEHGG